MRMISRRLVGAVAVVLALAALTARAAPITEPKPKGDSPADKARKALDQVMDLEVSEQTVQTALDKIKEETKLNIVFDRLLLQQGMNPNDVNTMPCSVKLQGVKARAALRAVLNPYSLTFAAIGDTVTITTEDQAITRILRQHVDIDVSQKPLATAIKDLAKQTGVTMIIDPRVVKEAQNPVTLQVDDVSLDTAVRLLAEVGGLKAARIGTVLMVTNKAAAADLRGETDLAPAKNPYSGLEQYLVPQPGGLVPGIGIAPNPPAIQVVPDKAVPAEAPKIEKDLPPIPEETPAKPEKKPEPPKEKTEK